MARIVLGLGTSHGPMLSTPPEKWGQRVAADRRNPQHYFKGRTFTFDALAAERAQEGLERQLAPEIWHERHAACRKAIAALAEVFAAAKPDTAVIVGNDQMEIFSDTLVPAFAVYCGETIENIPPDAEQLARMPPGIPISVRGFSPPEEVSYPCQPELGLHLVGSLVRDGFDVTLMRRLPERDGKRGSVAHAYGFVYRQIMQDRVIPHVPVLLNTFYPPNQPTVGRCIAFGRSLVHAIEAWKSDARVALIASGGLTHFVIDEAVDRAVIEAFRMRSLERLEALGEATFQAGTSEVKNWIPVAGAMAELGLPMTLVDYVPCYRSAAGTGNAMGFAYWQ